MTKTLKINCLMGNPEPEVRSDKAGDGSFGSPRGERTHNGVDLVCREGTTVLSTVTGKVTKIGYPYAKGKGGAYNSKTDPYRYVQITTGADSEIEHHRFFYVSPLVKLGQNIKIGEQIGSTMDVSKRYDVEDKPETIYNEAVESPMIPHLHYEILVKGQDKEGRRKFLDPQKYEYPSAPESVKAKRKR